MLAQSFTREKIQARASVYILFFIEEGEGGGQRAEKVSDELIFQ